MQGKSSTLACHDNDDNNKYTQDQEQRFEVSNPYLHDDFYSTKVYGNSFQSIREMVSLVIKKMNYWCPLGPFHSETKQIMMFFLSPLFPPKMSKLQKY